MNCPPKNILCSKLCFQSFHNLCRTFTTKDSHSFLARSVMGYSVEIVQRKNNILAPHERNLGIKTVWLHHQFLPTQLEIVYSL